MADALRSTIEFLTDGLVFGTVFLTGVLVGGISGFVVGRRANRRPPPRPEVSGVYRAAVEVAWADGTLSKAASDRLRKLECRLDIGTAQAEIVEREVMGRTKDEIRTPPREVLERYRLAVEVAGVGKGIEQGAKERLSALESEYGLSEDEADGVEREVLGKLKEEIQPPPAPPAPEPVEHGYAQYLAAVKLAWADNRLNRDEERQLGVLEGSLILDEDEADEIECEIMGGLREKIVRPDDPPEEQWSSLVEECVELVEELDRNMGRFDEPRRELADHTVWRLAEVLERSGVDLISDDEIFDKKRHQPVGSKASPDARIEKTLSPGFAVGLRVFRKAKVRVG